MVIKDFFIISQSGNRQHCFWLMMRHTHIFIYTHRKYLHTSIMKNNGAQIIQEGMQETNNWLNMASFKRLKCVIPIPREVKAIEMLLVQGKDRDRGSWNWMTSRFSASSTMPWWWRYIIQIQLWGSHCVNYSLGIVLLCVIYIIK